jgi:hypothetical protein
MNNTPINNTGGRNKPPVPNKSINPNPNARNMNGALNAPNNRNPAGVNKAVQVRPNAVNPNPRPGNKAAALNPSARVNKPDISAAGNTAAGVRRQPGNAGNMQNPNAYANSNVRSVRTGRAPDEFQRERTAVFDKVSNDKNAAKAAASQPKNDGTYHYTGKNIQSNRQKFVPLPDENISVSRNRNRDDDDEITEVQSGGLMSGIVKAVLYIVSVLVVSGILAYNFIMVANDVFAFVIPEPFSAEVTIPQDADIDDIADALADKKLIKYPGIFKLYGAIRGKDKNWTFESGNYSVSSDLGYDQYISTFRTKAAVRQIVRISIPEGFTTDEIDRKSVV